MIKMDIQIALDTLEISLEDIKISELTIDYIKKKYHKMALKWHPDKNNNSEYATKKFQKIQISYEYLLKEIPNLNTNDEFVSSSYSKESNIYSNILTTFISSIIKSDYNEILVHIIKEIVVGCNIVSVKMFEELNKEKAIEVYNLLYKYKDIFYIDDTTLEVVSSIIKEKYKNDKIYILTPTLKDIWDNNIFKLYVDDELYLVPLWHSELYFDAKDGGDIIVLCRPQLPTNITIDENNNIRYDLIIKIDSELSNIIKGTGFVSCDIGERVLKIPVSNLYIKEEQIYKIKGRGISRIQENDIYNVSCKGDVIVKIILS